MNWSVVKEPTILMTAAVYGLLELISILARLFGIWLGVLLVISFWRYCYSVLRAVAQGRSRIPPPELESFNPVGEWAVFWHLTLFPGLLLVTGLYLPAAFFAVALLVALAFPASAALMGLTSNIARALHPAAMIEMARTMGRDYLALVIGCVAILGGAFVVLSSIVAFRGTLTLLPMLIVLDWAVLAAFALIGSSLRAHRLEFEIPGELVPREEGELGRQHEEWHKVLDAAYVSLRSGLLPAGYKTLHELVDANGDSLEVNYWLVENMLEWENKKFALEVAAKLMTRLLQSGDGAGAVDLYRRCRRHDPEFRLKRADAEQLAEYARSFGHTGLADELSYN